jgi:hypothetical protein
MSEYQYYEFQALDKVLSPEARKEISQLSSRVQLSSGSASFVYNYGSFRGDPYQVLAKYFDAFLYITNWGTRQLMFRFPLNSIPAAIKAAYQFANGLEWTISGNYEILNIEFQDEDGESWGWVEGEGLLSGIAPLRNDMLRGDYRPLYLAWLKLAQTEAGYEETDEDLTEPPVPANLQNLSPGLRYFMEFYDISEDLVMAAAQSSLQEAVAEENLAPYLEKLPPGEQLSFLERLLQGEAHLDIALSKRLRELSGRQKAPASTTAGRSIQELLELAKTLNEKRRAEEARVAKALHQKKMETLAPQEERLWAQVIPLIEQKQTKAYEEAIRILIDLRDLAEYDQRQAAFQAKLSEIKAKYPTLSGLHRRLADAKLI